MATVLIKTNQLWIIIHGSLSSPQPPEKSVWNTNRWSSSRHRQVSRLKVAHWQAADCLVVLGLQLGEAITSAWRLELVF